MIAIINGCGANIASVQFALERLGKKSILTTDKKVISAASHVILPGVGTAAQAMAKLHALQLVDVIAQLKQPVLGICLGMQILFENSLEGGGIKCLGIIPGDVVPLPRDANLILPHIGWNQLKVNQPQSILLESMKNKSYVYFVHGYAAKMSEYTIAYGHYGMDFSAMVQKNNFYGMQFHPERSGKTGERLLKNFLEIAEY
jgi:glutamine amidotransferase